MKKITDLPSELAEEVLCRIPLTSLRRVRPTCKKFNTLTKHKSFAKKHLSRQERVVSSKEKEFTVILMMGSTVYLMRVNLHNNNLESSIKRQGRLIGLEDSYKIYDMFHCNGLFLCINENDSRHMVWHPYWGLNRWIESTHELPLYIFCYAFGYNKSTESHKILRGTVFGDFKIYDFNSDSWRGVDVVVSLDWTIHCFNKGLSLKGNTYWVANTKNKNYSVTRPENRNFLICFDFTRETFGPHLPLPFVCSDLDVMCLSSVREEQLVVLFQAKDTLRMEIWVTTKIESNSVSWNSKFFLEANIKQLIHPQCEFISDVSFFIDEEKKVVVVFDRQNDKDNNHTRFIGYIIGVDGSLKQVDLVQETHCELASSEQMEIPRYSYISKLHI